MRALSLLPVLWLLYTSNAFVPQEAMRSRLASLAPPLRASAENDATAVETPQVNAAPWTWRGHSIHTETCGTRGGQPVLLVHGFGCSTFYWRATAVALANAGCDVHAVDLLGQGRSAKPTDVTISINLWAAMVDDYARERMSGERNQEAADIGDIIFGQKEDRIVLMGNSLGSLVALAAALGDHADEGFEPYLASGSDRVAGICMYNCGVGLNSRGIANEAQWNFLQRFLIKAVLNTLDAILFDNPPVLRYVLREVVTPELLRGALEGLYRSNPTRVDDALVMSFYKPAKDEGAPEALRQIYTNDPGLSPMELHDKYAEQVKEVPIHLVWGDDDGVTPLSGGVGAFYSKLAAKDETLVSMKVVEGTGHIPFDDAHVESNESMLAWLSKL